MHAIHRRIPSLRSLSALAIVAFCLLPLAGCRGGVRSLLARFQHRKSASKPNSTDYADNIQQAVSQPQLPVLKNPDFSQYQPQVQQFYQDRNFELAWTRDGKPTSAATALIGLFQGAAKKGLKPEDYDASLWNTRESKLAQILAAHDTSNDAQDSVAQFDAAMTIAAMRYASDLHEGRVNPQSLNFDIDVPGKRAAFDLPTFVNEQLVDADDVGTVITGIEPQNPIYKNTEAALAHYIDLTNQQGGQDATPLPAVGKGGAGPGYPGMQALVARLQLEGDLSDASSPSGISDGIKHWQERHGLTDDGKLNQATIDSLNVPMTQRVQQLGLALERWRWLPDNYVQPRVLVNLPEYIVRTYDADHNLAFKMKVVDGEGDGQHDTPMFVRQMRYVVFRPYWNIPQSIIKKDLAKHLGDKGYLEKHGYEVKSPTDIRQKPGPKNSLGLVKFLFPNEYDIYLHSTPEMALFNLTKRDRSHGCVRLNDAEKVANWVLNGQGDWDADKIHQAMYGPTDGGQPEDNKTVNLKTTLPVVLTYLTANADEDGTVHFFDDVYGYDKQLQDALDKGLPYAQKTAKINPKLAPGETE